MVKDFQVSLPYSQSGIIQHLFRYSDALLYLASDLCACPDISKVVALDAAQHKI